MIRKYPFIIFLCLLSLNLIAQTELWQNTYSCQGLDAKTSLFTGQMTYSIPLYTLQDPDFQLDIALLYNSKGFKPFQPSGCFGQDWTLRAGGYITRTVHGLVDDQKFLRYKNGIDVRDTLWGFTRAMQAGTIIDKNLVFNFDASIYDTCGLIFMEDYGCGANKMDYLPDIFDFNFCGYKGRFIINNTGKTRIISGDFVKVDISQMQEYFACNLSSTTVEPSYNSTITIYTIDGYTYIFGGNSYALEYSVITKKNSSQDQDTPAITAWHLRKIIAPNGRILNFNYCPSHINNYNIPPLMSFQTEYDWTESPLKNDTTHIIYSLHKDCLLQSITTSDSIPLTISFASQSEAFKMYEHNDFSYCVPHLMLDSIQVSYGEDILRTVKLSYQYKAYSREFGAYPNYHWRYLRQVSISGIGKYTMTYDDINISPGSTPFPLYVHYPDLYPQNDAQYKNMVDRFGFWKVSSLQGMLREVSIPTGGKMKFSYENHQYGKERRFRVVNNQDVELYTHSTADLPIGGVRIEKIETYSNDSTLVETQTFSYNEKGTNSSSGIYYNIYEVHYPSFPEEKRPITNPNNYGMVDSYIGYSYVEKKTTIGNETYKTAYTYETGENNYSSAGNNYINRNYDVNGYKDTTEVCSGSLTYPEKIRQTGKIMSIDQYNGNSLTKTTLFAYNGIPNNHQGMLPNQEQSLGCIDTIVVLSRYSGHIARKLFIYPDVLEKHITYEYEGGNTPLITENTYTYDSKFRKKKEVSKDSRNRHLFTRYTYPDDIAISLNMLPPAQWPALYYMGLLNQINKPVEIVSGYKEGNTEFITSGTIDIYMTGQYLTLSNNYSLDSLHSQGMTVGFYPYLYKTMSLNLTAPISDYQFMSYEEASVIYDSRYRTICEYQFNNYYRPLLIMPYGKQKTKYTWIKGDDLYPSAKMIGNQTYTYTFKPYVGVSSITDPRGITTYYSYDSAGRLIEEYQIINGTKQVLNAYKYHIKTE